MKDLKQCPFCGGEGKLLTGVSKDKPYARIYCDKCKAVTQGVEDSECDDFERLEFNGDVYVWDELGRRKCLEPKDMADEEWDDTYCEKCRYKKVSNKVDITIITKPVEVAYKCPHCKNIIEMDYDDFESMMINEAPHWEHEEFCCDECGEDIVVEDIEWN